MRIFIDVDNTILEHTTFYNSKTEGRLHKIFGVDPVSNESAIMRMYESSVCSDSENLKQIFKLDNVYLLTKTANQVYEKYKRDRLAKLFNCTVEELINLRDNNNNPKYITVDLKVKKSVHLMNIFNIDNINNCILIDDYSNNIIEWEDDGGIGIKFNNQYNTIFHPKGGLVISNFKLFANLNTNTQLNNIITEPKLTPYFKATLSNYNTINYLSFVKKFILTKFEVQKNITENTRNDFTSFLNKCYLFIQEHNFDLLKTYMRENKCDKSINLIVNPFDYSSEFKSIIENQSVITVAYSKNQIESRFRDIYISIPTELYYENSNETIAKAVEIIKIFTNIK
ncbi:MAG: hypothetical protein ACK5NF_01215 [Bacilli bacterium]